jgi:hypothetical protein
MSSKIWLALGIGVIVVGISQIWEGFRLGTTSPINPACWGTFMLGIGGALIAKAGERRASS